jgi:hypothetical protein
VGIVTPGTPDVDAVDRPLDVDSGRAAAVVNSAS